MSILCRASFLSLAAVILFSHAGFCPLLGAQDFSKDFSAISWPHADKMSFDVPSAGEGREISPLRLSQLGSPYRPAYYQEDNFDRVMNALRANEGELVSGVPGLKKIVSVEASHRAEVRFGELVINVYFDRVDPAGGDIITINKPKAVFLYQRSPSGAGSFIGGVPIGSEGEAEKPADNAAMKELFESVKKVFDFISPNAPELRQKGLVRFNLFPEGL
ncbi:MAG: hypothetical protein WCU88_00860 [Elusimicrobiota bacterium]|jgi:hypothetical protein